MEKKEMSDIDLSKKAKSEVRYFNSYQPQRPEGQRKLYRVTELITRPYKDLGFWWLFVKATEVENHRETIYTDIMFPTKELASKFKVTNRIMR